MKKYCIALSIKGILKRPDKEIDGIMSTDNDLELNAYSIRKILKEHAEKGYDVFTGCNNIDEKGHCLGHEVKEIE